MGNSEERQQSEALNVTDRQPRISMGLHEEILEKNATSRIPEKMSLELKKKKCIQATHKPLVGSTRTCSAEARVPSQSSSTVLACSGWTVWKTGGKDLSKHSLSWLQHAFRETYGVGCWQRRKKSDWLSTQRYNLGSVNNL